MHICSGFLNMRASPQAALSGFYAITKSRQSYSKRAEAIMSGLP